MSDLKTQLEQAGRIDRLLSDAQTALELLQSDSGTDADMLEEATAGMRSLERELDTWELQRLLDMPYASSGAIMTITAGAGGTDAQVRLFAERAPSSGRLTPDARTGRRCSCACMSAGRLRKGSAPPF